MTDVDSFLQHYGVKGMHWGKRKLLTKEEGDAMFKRWDDESADKKNIQIEGLRVGNKVIKGKSYDPVKAAAVVAGAGAVAIGAIYARKHLVKAIKMSSVSKYADQLHAKEVSNHFNTYAMYTRTADKPDVKLVRDAMLSRKNFGMSNADFADYVRNEAEAFKGIWVPGNK